MQSFRSLGEARATTHEWRKIYNNCNPVFVYTEPEAGSGHKERSPVAYLAGKTVTLTVAADRDG